MKPVTTFKEAMNNETIAPVIRTVNRLRELAIESVDLEDAVDDANKKINTQQQRIEQLEKLIEDIYAQACENCGRDCDSSICILKLSPGLEIIYPQCKGCEHITDCISIVCSGTFRRGEK